MKLPEVLAALQLTEHADRLGPEWEASQHCLPEGELPFLAPEFIRKAAREAFETEGLAEAALPAAARIAEDEALRALAWHFHYRVYQTTTPGFGEIRQWPELEAALGEGSDAFYFLVGLSGFPIMQEVHRSHRLPAEVIAETQRNFRYWPMRGVPGSGEPTGPGHSQLKVAWYRYFFRGEIYRLGRLQYQLRPLQYGVHVYRHRTSGAVVALAADGTCYRADGQIDPDGAAEGWTATLAQTDDAVAGYPIHPVGRAVHNRVTLPLSEWQPRARPTDPSLHLHIPFGEPLTEESCRDSLLRARDFFAQYFPEYRYACFCCSSWTLNTWLDTILPPESNLLAFQREFYLFPVHLHPSSTIEFVFGRLTDDLSQAPRDTRLRRALLDLLESGGEIGCRGGGCFYLPEDLRWGEQVYRRQALSSLWGEL